MADSYKPTIRKLMEQGTLVGRSDPDPDSLEDNVLNIKEYASKGVAGAGLGTGIAGLSLGVINAMGGLAGLGGLFNNNRNAGCNNDMLSAMVMADYMRGRGTVPCGSDCDPVTQREMHLV